MDKTWEAIGKELNRRAVRSLALCRWRYRGQGALAVLVATLAGQWVAYWLG